MVCNSWQAELSCPQNSFVACGYADAARCVQMSNRWWVDAASHLHIRASAYVFFRLYSHTNAACSPMIPMRIPSIRLCTTALTVRQVRSRTAKAAWRSRTWCASCCVSRPNVPSAQSQCFLPHRQQSCSNRQRSAAGVSPLGNCPEADVPAHASGVQLVWLSIHHAGRLRHGRGFDLRSKLDLIR